MAETKISLNIFLSSDAKGKRQQKRNRFAKRLDFQVKFSRTPEEFNFSVYLEKVLKKIDDSSQT